MHGAPLRFVDSPDGLAGGIHGNGVAHSPAEGRRDRKAVGEGRGVRGDGIRRTKTVVSDWPDATPRSTSTADRNPLTHRGRSLSADRIGLW